MARGTIASSISLGSDESVVGEWGRSGGGVVWMAVVGRRGHISV